MEPLVLILYQGSLGTNEQFDPIKNKKNEHTDFNIGLLQRAAILPGYVKG